MKYTLWLILVLAMGMSSTATAAEKHGGLAVSYAKPDGEFKNVVDDGYGLSAIFDYPMAGTVNISGSLGWYKFEGRTILEGTNIQLESTTVWEFSVGPQIDFGKLYVGLEGGYYTDLNEWGLVGNAGIRKGMLDVSVRYKATEDGKFMALRLGFFF